MKVVSVSKNYACCACHDRHFYQNNKGVVIMTKLSTSDIIIYVFLGIWAVMYIIQALMAFGTAYRCTKLGNDNGTGLFIYLIGFSFAALIPGLGLHYYIKYLPPKIVIQRPVQQQVIRVIDPSQLQAQARQEENYQQQADKKAYDAVQQSNNMRN